MSKRKLASRISLAIAFVFAAVSFLGVVTYRNTVAVRQGEAAVAHSYAVRETTRELFSSVKDMETGQRGYLISGDEAYLEPYQAGLDEVQDEFARLRKLTQDRPAQQLHLDELQQLLVEKRAVLAETVRLRGEDGGFEKARDVVTSGYGKALMNEMRAVVREMLREEQGLLAELEAAAKSRAKASERFILVGNLMTLALLVFSGVVAHFDRRERDKAEAHLRANRAELNAVIESAQDGIVTFGRDFRIRLMNPAAATMHACDAKGVVGRPLLSLVPARMRDDVANDMRTFVASQEQRRSFEGIALRDNDEEFPCRGSITKSDVGDLPFFTLTFRDLSESYARDAKIREQVEILNHVRDAILVCDMDDRIVFWNRGAESLHGYSAVQAIGQNVVELLFADQRQLWEAGRNVVSEGGVYSTELPQRDQDGRDIIIEHRRSLIHQADGKPAAQLILHFDITVRKHEEVYQRRSQRLESIGTLAGGISHDLNNVLTPILMSAKLLQRGGNHRERMLDMIVSSAERGRKMIRKLLSFAGGEQAAREQIDLREVVSETEEILHHTLPKNIDLHVECADTLHPVRGDATELSQVLMNLAINARDAMPNGGRLELRADNFHVDSSRAARSDNLQSGPHLLIRVSDTGSGISKENIERIFDPFFTTKEQGKGTGLGLATSLGIVRNHGGDITVSSRWGEGTSFSIYLPSATLEETATIQADAADVSPGRGELILLVDDEPLIVETVRAALEGGGYRVATAGGGAEAVAYYQDHAESVGAVLLDMMMPGMDGSATMDGLRVINPHVPIIASSGLRRPGAAGGRLANVDGFLPKPYSDDQLLRMVRRVLDTRTSKNLDETISD